MTQEPAKAPEPEKPFGAKRAALIFGANILAQFATGFFFGACIGFAYGFAAALQGLHPGRADFVQFFEQYFALPVGCIGVAVGTAVVYILVKQNFPGSFRDGALAPLGVVQCATRDLWLSALCGIAVALAGSLLVRVLFPPDTHNYVGPVAQAAQASMLGRYEWAFLAVLVAPPSEEFIFRGVLLTWGVKAAATVVSLLFVTIHLPEVKGYLPALLSIGALAVATVVARYRTGSLMAPLAVHMGYNMTLVFLVFQLSGP
jgi:membrane protease YdiL (CAAX protease family)